ncbi:hypothetical protein BLNAU_14040 [Blattamonas nauphoetae]|uniref:Uncharacterized protein n=1 Tax=Blattamonas nauphoetae TaxID=2049346 RepID=A0ABQ9XHA3_9EUKA|nr:hypothetical protein BLNAU_14040 [Blattamonas nauphoetae]
MSETAPQSNPIARSLTSETPKPEEKEVHKPVVIENRLPLNLRNCLRHYKHVDEEKQRHQPLIVEHPSSRLVYTTLCAFLPEFASFSILLSYDCAKAQECSGKDGKLRGAAGQFYRCPAHDQLTKCTAINYQVHVIQYYTERLSSPMFVNWITQTSDGQTDASPPDSTLYDIPRYLERILLHAKHHHSDLYNTYENAYHFHSRFRRFFLDTNPSIRLDRDK